MTDTEETFLQTGFSLKVPQMCLSAIVFGTCTHFTEKRHEDIRIRPLHMFKLLGSSSSAHFELIILSSPHMIYSKGAPLVLVNICSYSTCTQLMTPKDFSTMKVGIYIHQLDTSKNCELILISGILEYPFPLCRLTETDTATAS